MSYIRALSNPESLYVLGNKNGVEFYYGNEGDPNQWFKMPGDTFDRMMKAYHESHIDIDEPIVVKYGANSWELRENPESYLYDIYCNSDFQVGMHKVTWDYMYHVWLGGRPWMRLFDALWQIFVRYMPFWVTDIYLKIRHRGE